MIGASLSEAGASRGVECRGRRSSGGRGRAPPGTVACVVRGPARRRGRRPVSKPMHDTSPRKSEGYMRHSFWNSTLGVAAVGLAALAAQARAQLPPNTNVPNLSGFGVPLLGVIAEVANGNTANFELFADGQFDFTDVETLPEVGPIFNSRSCGGCHFQPALGGSGGFINEVRVRKNNAGGPLHLFGSDNILRLGPQKQGNQTIF